MIEVLATVLGVTAAFFNAWGVARPYRRPVLRWVMAAFCVVNSLWMYLAIVRGDWWQTVLFGIYLLFAIYGVWGMRPVRARLKKVWFDVREQEDEEPDMLR